MLCKPMCYTRCRVTWFIQMDRQRETDGSDCGTYNNIMLCKPVYCTRWRVTWFIQTDRQRETDGSDCGTCNDIMLCKPIYCTRRRVTWFIQTELVHFKVQLYVWAIRCKIFPRSNISKLHIMLEIEHLCIKRIPIPDAAAKRNNQERVRLIFFFYLVGLHYPRNLILENQKK